MEGAPCGARVNMARMKKLKNTGHRAIYDSKGKKLLPGETGYFNKKDIDHWTPRGYVGEVKEQHAD